jgi:hypothetical protein
MSLSHLLLHMGLLCAQIDGECVVVGLLLLLLLLLLLQQLLLMLGAVDGAERGGQRARDKVCMQVDERGRVCVGGKSKQVRGRVGERQGEAGRGRVGGGEG